MAISACIIAVPWSPVAAAYAAYLAARLQLGRWPVMWVDDPMIIPGPPLSDLPIAFLTLCFYSAPIVLISAIIFSVRGLRPDQRWAAVVAGLIVASWCGAVAVMFIFDAPWNWLID